MKWVVGGFTVFSGILCAYGAQAQGTGTAPPTAQFPTAPAQPAEPAASAQPAAPGLESAPPPPPGAAPPPAASPAPYPPPAYPPPPAGYPPPPGAYPPPPDTSAAASDSDQVFSLTISPLHLVAPILELTGEVRVTPHFGVALIGGYGEVSVNSGDLENDSIKLKAYEIGGQLVGYPIKKFKSLQLGLEVLYLSVSTVPGADLSGTAAGVAVGPLIGYKLITAGGFTFFAQGGFEHVSVQAQSSGDTAKENTLIPLLNLNIGWSF